MHARLLCRRRRPVTLKRLLDPHHPLFERPLWRWLTTLMPLAWAGIEFYNQQILWALLFLAAGLYAGWMLFVVRAHEISARGGQDKAAPSDRPGS